ncbi:hypothetical protein [Cedecea sp. NFIX57]|uniref:hypothetical protein n=1 Tax=Cedecea sp. NFIX57 TaxID=1566286 RepID=UPI00111C2A94|nr:hypothetical protein [Cedecea sp. NFIX57]
MNSVPGRHDNVLSAADLHSLRSHSINFGIIPAQTRQVSRLFSAASSLDPLSPHLTQDVKILQDDL